MLVRDLMGPIGPTAGPDTSLRDAAELLASSQGDVLPVVLDGQYIGLVTATSLQTQVDRHGLATGSVPVSAAIDPDAAVVTPETEGATLPPDFFRGSTVAVVESGRLVGLLHATSLAGRGVGDGVAAALSVSTVDELVPYDADHVEYESDGSFPASDPGPPPSSIGGDNG